MCPPNDTRAHSRAHAKHCRHACQTRPLKSTCSALHACLPHDKHTRSREHAQRCARTGQIIIVPAQGTCSGVHTCQPHYKHTRSRAHAQHCTHACNMITPAQEHQHCTRGCQMISAPAQEHALNTGHTCRPNDKRPRSRAHDEKTRWSVLVRRTVRA